jgi:hypothetical protein
VLFWFGAMGSGQKWMLFKEGLLGDNQIGGRPNTDTVTIAERV